MNNFYIPLLIFLIFCQPDGTEIRTCIDGRQRLNTFYLFTKGLIPCVYSAPDKLEPLTKRVWESVCGGDSHILRWYVDHAQSKQLLTRQQRHHLDGTQLTIMRAEDVMDVMVRAGGRN
jgi:hypothetical protein